MPVPVTLNAVHYEIQSADPGLPLAQARLRRFPGRPGAEAFVRDLVNQNPQVLESLGKLAGLATQKTDASSSEQIQGLLVEGLLEKRLLVTRGSSATGGGASRPPSAMPRKAPPSPHDRIDGNAVLSSAMKSYLKQQSDNDPDQSPIQASTSQSPGRREEPEYEFVVEVAGRNLYRKQSVMMTLPDGTRTKRYVSNDPESAHRSLACFSRLDNSAIKLDIAVPMRGMSQPMCLPLKASLPVYGKGTTKALWDNVLIPVKPLQFLNQAQSKSNADIMNSGWLYVFWNGAVWRELQVSGKGMLSDVNLSYYRDLKADNRPAEGHWLDAVWIPNRLDGQEQRVILAASAVQWSWSTLSRFEANPDAFRDHASLVQSLGSYEAQALFDDAASDSGSIMAATVDQPASDRLLKRQQPQRIATAYLPKTGASLRIKLRDDQGMALSQIDFSIDLGERALTAKTDNQGVLTLDIPDNLDQSQLHFYRKTPEHPVQAFSIRLNQLAGVDTIAGLQARLNNLGFDAGPVDGINGRKTKAATREFQACNQLQVDGISGSQTQSCLFEVHGS